MTVTIKWADATLKKYEREIVQLAAQFPKVIPQEINKVGDRVRSQVVRTLTKQTGLPKKTIQKAVVTYGATPGKLFFTMKSAGGDIRLRFFKPRGFCVYCPMGTMTQGICQLKHRGENSHS